MVGRGLKGGGSRARKRQRRAPRWTSKIEEQNKRCGGHWFDKDTKRFFRSRISERAYPGCNGSYFVSSEKGPHGGRRYSVRVAKGSCNISTVGEFQGYASSKSAHAAAKRLAASSCRRGRK